MVKTKSVAVSWANEVLGFSLILFFTVALLQFKEGMLSIQDIFSQCTAEERFCTLGFVAILLLCAVALYLYAFLSACFRRFKNVSH